MQTFVCTRLEAPIKVTKSQSTRERIAMAARKTFSAQGFERATIRAIADEAKIHASMVMRYFSSKEALFAAVVNFDLRLPDLASVPEPERGSTLVEHFIGRWEDDGGELTALLRAAVSHAAARERLTHIFEEQLTSALVDSGDKATAPERAALIASQMLGLALTRYVLSFESARTLTTHAIVEVVGPTIQRYLTSVPRLD